jgi:hypothetical protein
MLFDLRSRGRRRTVQVIYLFLALIMLSGLLLVGVGTGSGGGLLNAFTNNGSGNNSAVVKSSVEKQKLKLTQQEPNNPAAWDQLVQAEWSTFNGLTSPTAAKRQLGTLTQTYAHYQTLTKNPDPNAALLASRAYAYLGQYSQATAAKQIFANANPTNAPAFECLALAAYAAKNTRLGDLAIQKALSLVPKASVFELQQTLNRLKASPTSAASC